MKDKSGREIAVGDFIVYGHALGTCAGLQYGKVLGFGERLEYGRREDRPKLPTCKVRGVDTDYTYDGPRLMKPSTLQFSERILVVTRDQVPANVLELLETV